MSVGKVLVGGGSGFLGVHLRRKLEAVGYEVINVSRHPKTKSITWSDVSANGLPKGTTAVVSMAGEPLLNPMKRWNEELKESIYTSRVQTTETLARAVSLAAEPPKVFISLSGVGYYPPSDTAEYTEESDGGSGDFLAELCTDWESAAELPSSCPTRSVVLRTGVVLSRDGGAIQQMYYPFFFGLGGKIGRGSQWWPWIHVEDVCGILKFAIEEDKVNGILNGVSPGITTNETFTKEFARAMWRPAVLPVPEFAVKLGFGPVRSIVLLEGQKVIPKRVKELGYDFKYPDIVSACKDCSRFLYVADLNI